MSEHAEPDITELETRESKLVKDHPIHHVFGQLFLVVSHAIPYELRFTHKLFTIDDCINYIGFCDDFGPMNLGSIHQFCAIISNENASSPTSKLALYTSPNPIIMTNTTFLLGSYLIMIHGWETDRVSEKFDDLRKFFIPYRDVSPGIQNFSLHLRDCWDGLLKAKKLSWVSFGPSGFDPVSTC